MFYGAKNLTLKTKDFEMDYITFGRGTKSLVMIPGLGFTGVKGSAILMAVMYRRFAKEYKVYFFDRKADIPEGYSIEEIAYDTACAMKMLGLQGSYVVGVSQGGMIAQRIAEEFPELVAKLVLCVTLARQNDTVNKVINNWIELVKRRDFKAVSIDTIDKIYSDAHARKSRWAAPLFSKIISREDPERFIILAKSCLNFDGYDDLDKIKCPVLVLGGKEDKIVTGEASCKIADKLGCKIYMYDGQSHSLHEERKKDFDNRIYEFFKEK